METKLKDGTFNNILGAIKGTAIVISKYYYLQPEEI